MDMHPDIIAMIASAISNTPEGASVPDETELEKWDALAQAAAPGAWYPGEGEIVRHNRDKVTDPTSLMFMAKSREIVPRAMRAVKALRYALGAALAKAEQYKRAHAHAEYRISLMVGTRTRHETGPAAEIERLADYLERTNGKALAPRDLARELRMWLTGGSMTYYEPGPAPLYDPKSPLAKGNTHEQ